MAGADSCISAWIPRNSSKKEKKSKISCLKHSWNGDSFWVNLAKNKQNPVISFPPSLKKLNSAPELRPCPKQGDTANLTEPAAPQTWVSTSTLPFPQKVRTEQTSCCANQLERARHAVGLHEPTKAGGEKPGMPHRLLCFPQKPYLSLGKNGAFLLHFVSGGFA